MTSSVESDPPGEKATGSAGGRVAGGAPRPKSKAAASKATGTAASDSRPQAGTAATRAGTAATQAPPRPAKEPRRVLGYHRQRFEARKVRRLIRHVDPWSALKLTLLLGLCMWVVGMISAVIIWAVANNTGALSSFERFLNDNLQLNDFRLDGPTLFRLWGLLSMLGVLGFAAAVVIATLVFNLISDIIGGVWVSVIEEETARPIVDARS